MVTKTITKEEFTKELLPAAQKIIDEKVKGPKLKEKKDSEPSLYETEAESVRNKELSVEQSLKEKKLKHHLKSQ